MVSQSHQWRREWAYGMIARSAAPPPRYGSPEWLALPDGPEKVASVVIAAEAWAREGEDLRERLALELGLTPQELKRLEDAAYLMTRDAHRASWNGRAGTFRRDPVLEDEIDREWREWADGAA